MTIVLLEQFILSIHRNEHFCEVWFSAKKRKDNIHKSTFLKCCVDRFEERTKATATVDKVPIQRKPTWASLQLPIVEVNFTTGLSITDISDTNEKYDSVVLSSATNGRVTHSYNIHNAVHRVHSGSQFCDRKHHPIECMWRRGRGSQLDFCCIGP